MDSNIFQQIQSEIIEKLEKHQITVIIQHEINLLFYVQYSTERRTDFFSQI